MKICWDNLEGLYLSKEGNLRKGSVTYSVTYIEVDKCENCGDPYLAKREKYGLGKFCDHNCYALSKRGTKHSEETKKKISAAQKDIKHVFGRKVSDETRKKIGLKQRGSKHHNYKGGVYKLNIPLFDTHDKHINYAEQTRYVYENGLKVLQVMCAKCENWFTPTRSSVNRRRLALEGKKGGECKFYCSDVCKERCEVFNRRQYPKGFNNNIKNDYKVWRQEVLRRNKYECEFCGDTATEAHHERPKKLEPFFALDPDNGIACCEKCHNKYGHKDECSTGKLASIICGGGR